MRRMIIGILFVLTATVGCASGTTDAPAGMPRASTPATPADLVTTDLSPREQTALDASRESTTAPNSFRGRSDLPSCGVLTISNLPPGDQQAPDPQTVACFEAAAKADGAELVVLSWTIEGDPIIHYYRVGPGIDGIDVFIDNSRDNYGSDPGWRYVPRPLSEIPKLRAWL